MHILRVDDVPSDYELAFDLLVCASGYEQRSTYLFGQLKGEALFRSVLVLGFENSCAPQWRAQSDSAFMNSGVNVSIVQEDHEQQIFSFLRRAVPSFRRVRLLIDYSSMPRKWINAILNYFKFSNEFDQVELHFSYTMGRHVDRDKVPEYPESDYQISSVESLTTLEGASVRQRQTLAVVGLGFEWISPFAACELIEPDEVKVFYGEPGSVEGYGTRALDLNKRFLSEFCRDEDPLPLPVMSVEHVYRTLGELIAPAISHRNVTLIPLGPKPHVLGCILIANRLPQITCMYVRGSRERVQQVEAVGGDCFVRTKVELVAGTFEMIAED